MIDFLSQLIENEKIEIAQILKKSGIPENRGRAIWRGKKYVEKEKKGENVKWVSATKGKINDLESLKSAYPNIADKFFDDSDSTKPYPTWRQETEKIRLTPDGDRIGELSKEPDQLFLQYLECLRFYNFSIQKMDKELKEKHGDDYGVSAMSNAKYGKKNMKMKEFEMILDYNPIWKRIFKASQYIKKEKGEIESVLTRIETVLARVDERSRRNDERINELVKQAKNIQK